MSRTPARNFLVECKSQFIEMFGDPAHNSKGLQYQLLGDVCLIERGGSPRPISNYITTSSDGINWIKIGDADDTRYINKTSEKIIPDGIKKSRYVQKGDLILSNSMSFGHPYILNIDGCIHDGWLVLHFDKKIFNSIYLQMYLSLPQIYDIFSAMAGGGVVSNLNSELVRRLPVIIPTIEQQEIFESFILQIDKSKFELKKTIESLEALYKSIIAEYLG